MKWAYVELEDGDWCALYVDGKLEWQGHTGDVEWPWRLTQGLPDEFTDLGRFSRFDSLPPTLAELTQGVPGQAGDGV
jgi:hypothetical protein